MNIFNKNSFFMKKSLGENIYLKFTLEEGPMRKDQWNDAILLVESLKLVPRA
jgi:hypothetical protein